MQHIYFRNPILAHKNCYKMLPVNPGFLLMAAGMCFHYWLDCHIVSIVTGPAPHHFMGPVVSIHRTPVCQHEVCCRHLQVEITELLYILSSNDLQFSDKVGSIISWSIFSPDKETQMISAGLTLSTYLQQTFHLEKRHGVVLFEGLTNS